MCKIAFDHELGNAWHPCKVYCSPEALLSDHDCANECGIVEVEVKQSKIIKDSSF